LPPFKIYRRSWTNPRIVTLGFEDVADWALYSDPEGRETNLTRWSSQPPPLWAGLTTFPSTQQQYEKWLKAWNRYPTGSYFTATHYAGATLIGKPSDTPTIEGLPYWRRLQFDPALAIKDGKVVETATTRGNAIDPYTAFYLIHGLDPDYIKGAARPPDKRMYALDMQLYYLWKGLDLDIILRGVAPRPRQIEIWDKHYDLPPVSTEENVSEIEHAIDNIAGKEGGQLLQCSG